MLYRTDDLARWGPGTGVNLAPVEIDTNFWELAERLVAVEATAGEAANGIASIAVTGSQMTVYLDDGTALGPYTLPTAMIRYRGDWTAATAYVEMDLVTVPGVGVYLVLREHISGAAFDALAEDAEGNPLYRFLFPMGTGRPSVSDEAVTVLATPTDLNFVGDGVSVADDGDGTITVTIPGGGSGAAVSDEGVQVLAAPTDVNYAGAGVSVADDGDGTVTVTIPGGGATGVSDEGVQILAAPSDLNFAGAGVSVADDGDGSATITIPGGSGAAVSGEGVQVLAAPTDIDFAGAGVAVADDGDGTVTVTIDGGSAGALGDLSDVTLAAPAAADFLRFDGAAWVDAPVAWGDIPDTPATFAPSAHTHPATDIAGAVVETIDVAAYTQVAADHRKWKRTTSASAVAITIDANVNVAEDEITFQQGADGQITFAAGAVMTLTSSGSFTSAGPGAVVGIKFLSATEATLFGHTTGEAAGNMLAATYDPTAIAADAFARANHTGEQLMSTVTNLAGKSAFINGNFDIWQRGTSLAAATGKRYLADRWYTFGIGTTVAPSRQAFTAGQTDVPGEPAYYQRAVVSSVAGAGNLAVFSQIIEDVRTFAGQTVTFSFSAKADAAKDIAVELVQSFGSGGSVEVTGIGSQLVALTTSWQRFEITISVPSISGKTVVDGSRLHPHFWLDAGADWAARSASLGQQSGTFDFAQAQIELGSTATAFDKRPVVQEVTLCQRYYQVVRASSRFLAQVASEQHETAVPYMAEMRTAPTITKTTFAHLNLSGSTPDLLSITSNGARFRLISAAAGDCYAVLETLSMDAEL